MLLRKILSTFMVLALCYVSVGIGQHYKMRPGSQLTRDTEARATGNPYSLIWLVEYVDYQCASCREATSFLKAYLKENPGAIYLQVRLFPLTGHPHGFRSAKYAECAAKQGRFLPFHELVFARQPEWSPLPDINAIFHQYAAEVGIDTAKLDICLEDPAVDTFINDEKAAAKKLGIDGTPTFFLNGKLLVGRRQLEEGLAEALSAKKENK